MWSGVAMPSLPDPGNEPAARRTNPHQNSVAAARCSFSFFTARCNICLGQVHAANNTSTDAHFAERPQEQEQHQQRPCERTELATTRRLCNGCSSFACRQGLSDSSLTAVVYSGAAAHVMAAYWIVGSKCLYACAAIVVVAVLAK